MRSCALVRGFMCYVTRGGNTETGQNRQACTQQKHVTDTTDIAAGCFVLFMRWCVSFMSHFLTETVRMCARAATLTDFIL